MSLRPPLPLARGAGIPSSEVTGLFCRIPLGGVLRHALAFSARTLVPDLGTSLENPISTIAFHGLQPLPEHCCHSRCRPLLSVTELQGLIPVRWNDDSTQARPKHYDYGLRCRWYFQGSGILTGFPFVLIVLRSDLGSTYSQLTSIAEKPWPFRRIRFSRISAVTYCNIFFCTGSIGDYPPTSVLAQCLPTCSFYEQSGLGS